MNKATRYLAFWLLVTVFGAASPGVSAQAAAGPDQVPVYALLSLIGDRLDTVVRRPQTGSLVDNNLRSSLPIADPVFDDVAVAAAIKAIRQAVPNAEFAAINTRSPVLFEKQRTLFEVVNGVLQMPEAVRNVIREQGAGRLVLIGKLRDDAQVTADSGMIDGAGKLEGLGFYLDGTWESVQNNENTGASQAGRGFIAPYTYLQLSLVDFPSGRLLGRRSIKASQAVGSGRAQQSTDDPWSALNAAEKVRMINALIDGEVGKAMAALMAR